MMRGWRAALGCGLVSVTLLTGCSSGTTGAPGGSVSPSTTQRTAGPDDTRTTGPTVLEPSLSAEALRRVAGLRVFFAHRSVGAEIVVSGVPAVFRKYGVDPPTVNDGVPRPGGSLGDRWLNQTDDPRSKLDDFEGWVRSRGVGQGSDVAFMKLGYVDVNETTDVRKLFEAYRAMMAGLERDYPNVTFLHTTISVTDYVPEHNAAYERFNQLMRAEYGTTGRLFDLARIFSTRPDGTRTQGRTDAGEVYYRMYEGYTTDGGHPNAAGAEVAATEMLRVIARATAPRSGGSP